MDDYTKDLNQTTGFNRFTINARKVINKGYEFARQYYYDQYEPIHLFLAILLDKDGVIQEVFNKLGIDVENTVNQIQTELATQRGSNMLSAIKEQKTPSPKAQVPVFSSKVKEIINESIVVSSSLNHVYVGSEHLLLSYFKVKDIQFIKEIQDLGLNYELLKNTLVALNPFPIPVNPEEEQIGKPRKTALPYFCSDMNEKSKAGDFPYITGRDKEIQRLIHILSRKTKNNPILVGDAGVGKTAIVEGFVNMIEEKKVPSSFYNKRVLSLDVAAILSGARLRGDVEERIMSVINEAIEDENIIIFIDEIHNIVGAGSVGGKDSLDIANILKPYLTSSELSIIGATTNDEYMKYFESDSALTRRFQPIKVGELDVESAKGVIYNIKEEFEKYHNVKIQKEAIDAAVELSKKFITDRFLPDKAIDVIDEAAASLKIGREVAIEPELNQLGEDLVKVQKQKSVALRRKDLEEASKQRNEEDKIINEIEDIIEGKKKVTQVYAKTITPNLIKDIIYQWTEIPIVANDITNKKLKDLAKNLKKRIIGQDHVVENVALAIQRSHLGLGDPKRPLASFLFLGPTGVGKTEMAKALAKELFGSEDLMFQINMSELMEMHSVSKLIGSPPGYVGFQEGGQLTTYVRKKPYSVILFDELEKAHPDALNLLLQILEEGSLNDSKGTKVNFKNTIIIMTSNIGAEKVSTDKKLGFDVSLSDEQEDKDEFEEAYNDMRDRILEELKYQVRPEFLNRIDLVDVFRGLNRQDTLEVTRLRVDDLKVRLISSGIVLEVENDVVEKINEEGYSREFGGRNIRRKVQEMLENSLTEYLLDTNEGKLSKKNLLKLEAKLNKEGKIIFIKR